MIEQLKQQRDKAKEIAAHYQRIAAKLNKQIKQEQKLIPRS